MKQVIYRRGWCAQCEKETLQIHRSEHEGTRRLSVVVTCTECLLEVPA